MIDKEFHKYKVKTNRKIGVLKSRITKLTKSHKNDKSKEYIETFKSFDKLVILLSVLKLPKNNKKIGKIIVKTERMFNLPVAIQINTTKGYEYTIYQDEKNLIVNSSLTNRIQSKVYTLSQAQKLIKEIINL